jgi:hypothetical protein
MDFCVDTKIKYYIDPPPEKLPQMEEVRQDRFSINQLNSLLVDFQELCAHNGGSNQIQSEKVVDLLVRKLELSRQVSDEHSFPVLWRQNFSKEIFLTITRNLDKKNTGTIDWRHLLTCVTLLNSKICDEVNCDIFDKALTSA